MRKEEFMAYVQQELRTARRSELPEQGYGTVYNRAYSKRDSIFEPTRIGIYSQVNQIIWGVEMVFPNPITVEEITFEHLSQTGIIQGYLTLQNRRMNYSLTTTDFETVATKKGYPEITERLLEKVIPDLFKRYYQ